MPQTVYCRSPSNRGHLDCCKTSGEKIAEIPRPLTDSNVV